MKIDVQFINFPKSELIRSAVLNKISDCVEKYTQDMTASVKAFFSVDGFVPHIKISVASGKTDVCVNGSANDVARALDDVLNKLEASLRKISTKRKHKKAEFPPQVKESSDFSATNLRYEKRVTKDTENVFDKYEINYVSDFEDKVRKVS